LVETTHTLLLGTNIPLRHWSDSIPMACFLINWMPCSSLDNKTPYSILFIDEALFHVTPHVFGCVCFVHDMSPSQDKLSTRTIKYIFLGYSNLQEG